ncbi:MAG: nucleoside-diphosphate sugar epimerase/dehydratase [Croceibacterium sp.]
MFARTSQYGYLAGMVAETINQLLALPRSVKRFVALAVDISLIIFTVALSYWIRLDEWIRPVGNEWLPYLLAVGLSVPLFVRLGFYRAIFRHTGFAMLVTITYGCVVYALLFGTIITFVGIHGVPRTLGVLQPMLMLLAVIASRVAIRGLIDWRTNGGRSVGNRKPVIVYGAGEAGRQLANAARASDGLFVVAFVDDDKTLQGGVINGISVHSPDDLEALVGAHGIQEILLAVAGWTRYERQQVTTRILAQVAGRHVMIRTLPSLMELAHGEVTVNDLREVEIGDLLGRDAVPPNELLLARKIRGRTVMVTGAGGSIGSELCLQILAQRPARLVLVDVSEFNLYRIECELREAMERLDVSEVVLEPVLVSVQNAAQVAGLVGRVRPEIIYHAAAYKHVPMVESNVAEAVANNVFGTLNVAQAALDHEVSDMVLISTDKAVRPTNVMGATKRLAEQILQALACRTGRKTCFAMVRFGNVLGSSGSVVPLFRQQIKAGGPVTLTHMDITRYFMTIPEAAQLVIQAGAMAKGGEVFLLDMGDPVRIADLARLMIELSGLTVRTVDNPEGDIEIREVGMRPGEKLYEELLIGDNARPTKHSRILQATEPFLQWPELQHELYKLGQATAGNDEVELIKRLVELVPGYQPDHRHRTAIKATAV